MTLKDDLNKHLKEALKAKDTTRKNTIRLAMTAIKLAEVEKGEELDDKGVLGILQKEAKARQETIADAVKANRPDMIEEAKIELAILQEYLPEALTPEELEALVKEAIGEVEASSMADMGKVMQAVMPKVQDRADGGQVNQLVRQLLQN
jgi:uncharacterized protein YqeY